LSHTLTSTCTDTYDACDCKPAYKHSVCFQSVFLENSTFYLEACKTIILSCIEWQGGKMDILYAVDEMRGFYDTSCFLIIGRTSGVLAWPKRDWCDLWILFS